MVTIIYMTYNLTNIICSKHTFFLLSLPMFYVTRVFVYVLLKREIIMGKNRIASPILILFLIR